MKCSIRGNQEAVEVGNMGADFILHPLIHTFLKFTLVQDMVFCRSVQPLRNLK